MYTLHKLLKGTGERGGTEMWTALTLKQRCKHPVKAPTLVLCIWERKGGGWDVCTPEHSAFKTADLGPWIWQKTTTSAAWRSQNKRRRLEKRGAEICSVLRFAALVSQKRRVGERKPNKQVSLRLHRMFNYRHQNRDDRWIINIAYIYHETKNKQPSTFRYADGENTSGFFIHVFKNIWTFRFTTDNTNSPRTKALFTTIVSG